MNASEQPSDHGDSKTVGCCIVSLVALLLLVVQIVFSLVTYPLLPDIVPSHWNAAGQVNSTMPKGGFVLGFVGLNLGLYILLLAIGALVRVLTTLEGDERRRQMASSIVSVVTFIPLVITLGTQVVTTGVILHW